MPNKKRCLSAEQIEFLIKEYQAGRSASELAVDLRVSMSSAVAYLKNAGIERRGTRGAPKLVTREIAEKAKAMHEAGALWKQISAKLGLSTSALQFEVYKLRKEDHDTSGRSLPPGGTGPGAATQHPHHNDPCRRAAVAARSTAPS